MDATRYIETARAVARETGWNLEGFATEREWDDVGLGPVGHHRDSDELAESNWHTVLADLEVEFPEEVEAVSFNHWAVGWVEELAFNAGNPKVLAAVDSWHEKLDSYPVADEEDLSRRELEGLQEYFDKYLSPRLPDGRYWDYTSGHDSGDLMEIAFRDYSISRADDVSYRDEEGILQTALEQGIIHARPPWRGRASRVPRVVR